MKNRILISQCVKMSEYDIKCELSTEWTELFNKFKDTELIINITYKTHHHLMIIINDKVYK